MQRLAARLPRAGLTGLGTTDAPEQDRWHLARVRSNCGAGIHGFSSHLPDARDTLDDPALDPCR